MAKRKSSGNPVDKAVASERQFGRKPVGNSMPKDAVAATTFDTGRAQLKRKNNAKGGAIEAATANHRSATIAERLGARYAIGIGLPGPESVEARATQSNGRIVRSVMGSKNNFWDQARVYGNR